MGIQPGCSAVAFVIVVVGCCCCGAAGPTRIAPHPQIVPQNKFWDVVLVTGKGSSATSHTGVSTLYTMDGNTGKMKRRGTVDRVCSGNTYFRIGWPGQGPGKIARAMTWNRVLNMNEIQQVAQTLTKRGCKTDKPDKPKGDCTDDLTVMTTMWSCIYV